VTRDVETWALRQIGHVELYVLFALDQRC
jgi:hypothetical protein